MDCESERPDSGLCIGVISREVVLGQSEEIQDVVAGDERVVGGDRVALADRTPARHRPSDRVGDLLEHHGLGGRRGLLGRGRSATPYRRRQTKRRIDVDAQHLAEVGRQVLAGIERVTLEPAITVSDVETAIRSELDVATDMVRIGLRAEADYFGAFGIGDIRDHRPKRASVA